MIAEDFLQNRVSVGTNLTTTAAVTCYTAEIQSVQLAGIRATNKITTAQTLTLSWVDASPSGTFRLYGGASVPAGAHIYIPFDDGLTLRENDTITAQCDAANAIDIVVTVIEPAGRLR